MVTSWIWSFIMDNILLLVIIGICAGIVIRFFVTASNPIGLLNDVRKAIEVNPLLSTIIASILVILLVIWWYTAKVSTLEKRLAEKDKEIAVYVTNINTLTSNVERLEQGITDSNKAVKQFDDFSKETKRKFTELNTTIAKSNKDLALKIQDIYNEKKPETCDAAIKYLIDATKEYPR